MFEAKLYVILYNPNVFYIVGKVAFIDYEFGAYNYAAYDIANHFCEFPGKRIVHVYFWSLMPSNIFWQRKMTTVPPSALSRL